MRFQISFLLVVLAPQCQAQHPVCPPAVVCPLPKGRSPVEGPRPVKDMTPGCCAKDPNQKNPAGKHPDQRPGFANECAALTDQKVCGEQIVCDWGAGPPSGQWYNADDDILLTNPIDNKYVVPICYESQDYTALRSYMATLKDDPHGTFRHQIGLPFFGKCGDCYHNLDSPWAVSTWRRNATVAPGVTQYTFVRPPKMASATVV